MSRRYLPDAYLTYKEREYIVRGYTEQNFYIIEIWPRLSHDELQSYRHLEFVRNNRPIYSYITPKLTIFEYVYYYILENPELYIKDEIWKDELVPWKEKIGTNLEKLDYSGL